jgi:hypothetical protein
MWPMPLAWSPNRGTGWTPAVLSALAQGPAESTPAVGLGEEYRLSTPGLAGATLAVQGRVAHLMAFPVAEAAEAPEVNQ